MFRSLLIKKKIAACNISRVFKLRNENNSNKKKNKFVVSNISTCITKKGMKNRRKKKYKMKIGKY